MLRTWNCNRMHKQPHEKHRDKARWGSESAANTNYPHWICIYWNILYYVVLCCEKMVLKFNMKHIHFDLPNLALNLMPRSSIQFTFHKNSHAYCPTNLFCWKWKLFTFPQINSLHLICTYFKARMKPK